MEEKKLSIKKIAEITGYSIATVSRVINGKGKYSAATEVIIREVIKTHQFVPNMIAKGLRTNNAMTIGLIVPDITEEFVATITLAAQSTLFEAGYSAFICNSNEKSQVEARHLELLRAQNIGGIIFIGSESVYKGAVYDAIPKIYIDRVPLSFEGSEEYIFIESESYEGARMAIRCLRERGCRKIISILENKMISPSIGRHRGVQDELRSMDIDPDPTIHHCPITYEDTYALMQKIVDSGVVFDGLFCYNDVMAAGALSALKSRGIKVPEQVKVVGFDDISLASYYRPSITSLRQDMRRMGTMAANIMLELIAGTYAGSNRIKVPVELIERETTKNT